MSDDTRVEHIVILLVDGRAARLDPGPDAPVTLNDAIAGFSQAATAAVARAQAAAAASAHDGEVPS